MIQKLLSFLMNLKSSPTYGKKNLKDLTNTNYDISACNCKMFHMQIY